MKSKIIIDIGNRINEIVKVLNRLHPSNLTHHKNDCLSRCEDILRIIGESDNKELTTYLATKMDADIYFTGVISTIKEIIGNDYKYKFSEEQIKYFQNLINDIPRLKRIYDDESPDKGHFFSNYQTAQMYVKCSKCLELIKLNEAVWNEDFVCLDCFEKGVK